MDKEGGYGLEKMEGEGEWRESIAQFEREMKERKEEVRKNTELEEQVKAEEEKHVGGMKEEEKY